MASETYWTVVDYFLPMLRIQTLVMFLSGNVYFPGLLFSDWEIYDILWCKKHFVTMPMGVPLGVKLTFISNI